MLKVVSDREVDEAKRKTVSPSKFQWYEVDGETAARTCNGDPFMDGTAYQNTWANGRYFIQVISFG